MANYSQNPNTTHTLEEFISTGKSDRGITYYTTSILQGTEGILYSIDNVIFDYMDEIKEVRELVKLNASQYKHYMYDGVNLLAYDVYGNRDIAFLILAINGIYSPRDFTMNPIWLVNKNVLAKLLEEIYNAEREYLGINDLDVGVNR